MYVSNRWHRQLSAAQELQRASWRTTTAATGWQQIITNCYVLLSCTKCIIVQYSRSTVRILREYVCSTAAEIWLPEFVQFPVFSSTKLLRTTACTSTCTIKRQSVLRTTHETTQMVLDLVLYTAPQDTPCNRSRARCNPACFCYAVD